MALSGLRLNATSMPFSRAARSDRGLDTNCCRSRGLSGFDCFGTTHGFGEGLPLLSSRRGA